MALELQASPVLRPVAVDPRRPAAAVAERLRRDREQVVRQLSDGSRELGELTTGAEDAVLAIKVVRLAEVLPGVGKVAARRVLTALGIDDSTRWGELSPAKAASLVKALAAATSADTGRHASEPTGDGMRTPHVSRSVEHGHRAGVADRREPSAEA